VSGRAGGVRGAHWRAVAVTCPRGRRAAPPPAPSTPPQPPPSEGLNDGLTHMFVMSFSDATARDAYLPHPEHEAFKSAHVPALARIVVLDIETK
jgi:hypothetical protein